MIKLLFKLGCYASVAKPIQKYSLILGVSTIISFILFGIYNFFEVFFKLKSSLFLILIFYFLIFLSTYLLLKRTLSENDYKNLIKSRAEVSKKENIYYQFVLIFLLLASVSCFFIGMILGSELKK